MKGVFVGVFVFVINICCCQEFDSLAQRELLKYDSNIVFVCVHFRVHQNNVISEEEYSVDISHSCKRRKKISQDFYFVDKRTLKEISVLLNSVNNNICEVIDEDCHGNCSNDYYYYRYMGNNYKFHYVWFKSDHFSKGNQKGDFLNYFNLSLLVF